jgi:hypothetical protein
MERRQQRDGRRWLGDLLYERPLTLQEGPMICRSFRAPVLGLLLLASVSWLTSGCGSDAIETPVVTAPDTAGDTANDAVIACPGGYGCTCVTLSDCPAGSACLPTPQGLQCALPCVQGQCVADHACRSVLETDPAGSPIQIADLCVHSFPTACDPCVDSTTCKTKTDTKAACVALGGATGPDGWFCASPCTVDTDCGNGYVCLQAMAKGATVAEGRCLPSVGCACSPAAIAAERVTTCQAGGETSSCQGQRRCTADGLTACDAMTPSADLCDGLDNDCDGTTDEAVDCGDGNLCTDDSCGGAQGCVHLPNEATCDDGDVCTVGDKCAGSGCKPGGPANCDDGVTCTVDACQAGVGCVATPNDEPCNDGDGCTLDTCDKTADCKHEFKNFTCDDGDDCTEQDTCDQGKCVGQPIPCTDGNPCTTDACVTGAGCKFTPTVDPCDDGNACTGNDLCQFAACIGDVVTCDDGWGCTLDSCDPSVGCVFEPGPDANCGKAALPYTESFACDDPGLTAWKFAQILDPAAQNLGPKVTWHPVATSLPGEVSACALEASNGIGGIACGAGQSQVWVTADSPTLDASALAPGAPVRLRLDSAGTWGAAAKAQVLTSTDDVTWALRTTIPASGAVWGKVQVHLAALAGSKFKVRLQFSAPCGAEGLGWRVRSLTVVHEACEVNNGGCSNQAACLLLGSGQVQCTCKPGWQGDGKTCSDIDECGAGTAGCHANATCTNLPGGAECSCKAGYLGDGKTCTDVDECKSSPSVCSTQATCTNKDGSYACACNKGWNGDGKTCFDIDECKAGLATCSAQATCTNALGSYTCACKAGYTGDGKTCNLLGGADAPAATCLEILLGLPTSGNGLYWIDPDGAGVLPKVQLYCDMTGGGWTRVALDTFEVDGQGWSPAGRSACGGWGWILGGYDLLGINASVTKTFAGLPAHNTLRYKMDYVRIDSWDGEQALLYIAGKQVWNKVGQYSAGSSVCGVMNGWLEEKWPVDVTLSHVAASTVVVVSSTLNQTANDESFGIDNVEVWVK